MEAIAGMLEAVFRAICELIVLAVTILLWFAGAVLVLIVGSIIWMFTGKRPPIPRPFPTRRHSSPPFPPPSPTPSQPADSTDTLAPSPTQETPPNRGWPIQGIGVGGVLVLIAIGLLMSQSAEKRRKKEAKALVDSVAADVRAQWIPWQSGVPRQDLPVRDPWGNPLQLFLDETSGGTLFVVRSSGPDRKMATIDDLLSIKADVKSAKEFADDLGVKAAEIAKRRWNIDLKINRAPPQQTPVAP